MDVVEGAFEPVLMLVRTSWVGLDPGVLRIEGLIWEGIIPSVCDISLRC